LVQAVFHSRAEQVVAAAGQRGQEQGHAAGVEDHVGLRIVRGHELAPAYRIHLEFGDEDYGLQVVGEGQAHAVDRVARAGIGDQAAEQGGGDVIRVVAVLQAHGERQQFLRRQVEAEQGIGRLQAPGDRRGAAAQAAPAGDAQGHVDAQAGHGPPRLAAERGEGAVEQVRLVLGQAVGAADRDMQARAGFVHGELVVERQRQAEHVEAGTEIGRRGGHADAHGAGVATVRPAHRSNPK
jgi:hypothetical protein